VLRTAVDRGEILASVDPSTRAKGLVGTSQGLMIVGKAYPDEEALPATVGNAFADRPYISACRTNGEKAPSTPIFATLASEGPHILWRWSFDRVCATGWFMHRRFGRTSSSAAMSAFCDCW
jgi:hypothetical protein